jgi:predicted ATPase with chaperone activity
MSRLGLSVRGYDRVLQVVRTVSDLVGAARGSAVHVAEAVQVQTPRRVKNSQQRQSCAT